MISELISVVQFYNHMKHNDDVVEPRYLMGLFSSTII